MRSDASKARAAHQCAKIPTAQAAHEICPLHLATPHTAMRGTKAAAARANRAPIQGPLAGGAARTGASAEQRAPTPQRLKQLARLQPRPSQRHTAHVACESRRSNSALSKHVAPHSACQKNGPVPCIRGRLHFVLLLYKIWNLACKIRGSIVVSISACHAEDPGSIPGRGALLTQRLRNRNANSAPGTSHLASVHRSGDGLSRNAAPGQFRTQRAQPTTPRQHGERNVLDLVAWDPPLGRRHSGVTCAHRRSAQRTSRRRAFESSLG